MNKSLPPFTRACVLLVALVVSGCGNNRPFDSTAWLKADSRERGRMSQNLVDGKYLNGRSIDQVKLTLGEPQFNWGRVIQYHIDLGWPLKDSKNYALQVHFDESGTVKEVRIVD